MTEDVYKYQFDGDNWSLEIPPSTDNIKDYKTMVEESHTFNSVLHLLQNGKLQKLWPYGVISYRMSPSFRDDF